MADPARVGAKIDAVPVEGGRENLMRTNWVSDCMPDSWNALLTTHLDSTGICWEHSQKVEQGIFNKTNLLDLRNFIEILTKRNPSWILIFYVLNIIFYNIDIELC